MADSRKLKVYEGSGRNLVTQILFLIKLGISFPRFRKKSGGSWRDLSKEHIKN